MIDKKYARALPAQQPFQPGVPLDQRQALKILTVQVQEVECEEPAFPPPEHQVIEDGAAAPPTPPDGM